MSDFPSTRHEMDRAGYAKTGSGECRGCGAEIEWWKTTRGKSIPFDPIDSDYEAAVVHWATCPNAKDFKGSSSAPNAPAPAKYTPEQQVRMLRDRTDARIVILVTEQGTFVAYRNGIPGEDLRHDLIAAGNNVRQTVQQQETKR